MAYLISYYTKLQNFIMLGKTPYKHVALNISRCVWLFVLFCHLNNISVRHDPFDNLGGLGFRSGLEVFSDNIGARLFFSPVFLGRIFLITESYEYIGFRDNFMLNNVFSRQIYA